MKNNLMVRKFSLIVLFVIFGLTSSKAQKFEVGGQFGYGIANVYAENTSGNTRGVFHIGALGQYNFTNRWSVVTKLHYDQKGYKYSDGTNGKESISYLSVPLMAKFHFGKKVRGYVQSGGYVGFLLDAKGEDSFGRSVDTNDAYNSTDFGIAFGVGMDYPIADKLKLFAELELTQGIADIASRKSATVRNGASKFGVGVRYALN